MNKFKKYLFKLIGKLISDINLVTDSLNIFIYVIFIIIKIINNTRTINFINDIIARLDIKEVLVLNLFTISIAVNPELPDFVVDYDFNIPTPWFDLYSF